MVTRSRGYRDSNVDGDRAEGEISRLAEHSLQQLVERGHGLFVVAASALLALASWPLVVWLPVGVATRLRIARRAGAMIRVLAGVPVAMTGESTVGRPAVFVSNHVSVLDGPILFISIGGAPTFVVGSMFATMPLVGRYLTRIGCVFVGNGSRESAVELTAGLAGRVRSGQSVVVFAEGGVARSDGLQNFHLGAFRAATEAGAPVVPIAIVGTREVMAAGQRLPRPRRVRVGLGSPISPMGPDWRSLCAFRDAAHDAVNDLIVEESRS